MTSTDYALSDNERIRQQPQAQTRTVKRGHVISILYTGIRGSLFNKFSSIITPDLNHRQHHANVARSCLKLMSRNLKRDMRSVEDVGDGDVQHGAKEILHITAVGLRLDAIQYACCYWSYYLSLAENTAELLNDLKDFALTKALCWIEALAIIGKLETVEQSLLDATNWLAVCLFHYATLVFVLPLVADPIQNFQNSDITPSDLDYGTISGTSDAGFQIF